MTLVPSKVISEQQIDLLPNPHQLQLRGFWFYTRCLALPVFGLHVSLILLAELPYGLHGIILGIFSALLFTWLYFFVQPKPAPAPTSLRIKPDFLELRTGSIIRRIPRREVQFEYLGWGPCIEALLPAVRISHAGRPLLTMGTTTTSVPWAEIRKSVPATDYVVPEQTNWEGFIREMVN